MPTLHNQQFNKAIQQRLTTFDRNWLLSLIDAKGYMCTMTVFGLIIEFFDVHQSFFLYTTNHSLAYLPNFKTRVDLVRVDLVRGWFRASWYHESIMWELVAQELISWERPIAAPPLDTQLLSSYMWESKYHFILYFPFHSKVFICMCYIRGTVSEIQFF